MPAPIQRYGDPRLYGAMLVHPFHSSYQWIRTAANPLHPQCSLIVECAIRALKVITGAGAMLLTAVPALLGRTIEVIHYHILSADYRKCPQEVIVDNMRLPYLQPCPTLKLGNYHGTSPDAALQITRWGFDPTLTKSGARMFEAVYAADHPVVAAAYGINQLVLSLDIFAEEVAYASPSALYNFTMTTGKDLGDKKVMAAVRNLFYQNGYRAIQYNLDNSDTALAIYDPACITITKICGSPNGSAPVLSARPTDPDDPRPFLSTARRIALLPSHIFQQLWYYLTYYPTWAVTKIAHIFSQRHICYQSASYLPQYV